jgi:NADH:ubiquinone oxidoreductase subunit E
LHKLRGILAEQNLNDKVNLEATFCFENCANAPSVKIGDEVVSVDLEKPEQLIDLIRAKVNK